MTRVTLDLDLETARIIALLIPNAEFLNDAALQAGLEFMQAYDKARREAADAGKETETDNQEAADESEEAEAQAEDLFPPPGADQL
jgi:hypothetical protein